MSWSHITPSIIKSAFNCRVSTIILIELIIVLNTVPLMTGHRPWRESRYPRTAFTSQLSYPYNQEVTQFPLSLTQTTGTGWSNTENPQNDTQNDATFNKVVYFGYGHPPPPPPPKRRRILAHFLLGFTAGSAAVFGGAAAANAFRG